MSTGPLDCSQRAPAAGDPLLRLPAREGVDGASGPPQLISREAAAL